MTWALVKRTRQMASRWDRRLSSFCDNFSSYTGKGADKPLEMVKRVPARTLRFTSRFVGFLWWIKVWTRSDNLRVKS